MIESEIVSRQLVEPLGQFGPHGAEDDAQLSVTRQKGEPHGPAFDPNDVQHRLAAACRLEHRGSPLGSAGGRQRLRVGGEDLDTVARIVVDAVALDTQLIDSLPELFRRGGNLCRPAGAVITEVLGGARNGVAIDFR